MILLADDNDITRGAMRRLLRLMGENALEAPCGNIAVGLIAAMPVEIAIIDYVMPRGGVELLDRIRLTKDIPVILCTGLDPESFIGTKYDAYLWKPVNRDDIARALAFVRGKRSGRNT